MATKSKDTSNDEIRLGLLPGLLGYQLRLAQIALFQDFSDSLGKHAITPGLFGVLVIIEANPGLKQNDLARATHLDRSTVVSLIDNLERRNLVQRRPALNDRRSNSLWLTEDGTVLLRKLKRLVAEHEKRLVADMSTEERATLVRLLGKILSGSR